MSDAPLLSIEAQIAHSILLDRASKRVGISHEQARELCAIFAEYPIRVIEDLILGAYDHKVKRANQAARLRKRR